MSLTKCLLILKPIVQQRRQLSQAFRLVEDQGFLVADMYMLPLAAEDVCSFYELLVEVPDQLELDSYAGGPSVVLALTHDSYASLGARSPFQRKIQGKFAVDTDGSFTSFWFGKMR